MSKDPRLSMQSMLVLRCLLTASEQRLSGAEISRATSLQSGTLYPILARLEDAGWLESEWEAGDPKAMGRPRRRYYWVTGLGQTRARAELNKLQPLDANLAWGWAKA